MPQAISISHPVTLFPQPTGMTCWSAAATMLFGNRSVGPGQAGLGSTGGLKSDFGNIQLFARSQNLKMHAPQSWSVMGLAELLRSGPLWVAGAVPSGHAYVIGAMKGDRSPGRTTITIYDPWPPNRGAIRTISYGQWMQNYPMATTYILHR